MADRIVRSIFWLCAFSGLGYGLFALATSDENQVNQLRKKLPGVEKDPVEISRQNRKFTDVLRGAIESNKPLYRMSKEEIEKEIKKQH